MTRFKYVIAENNIKQQVAVIFAREIEHSKFKYSLKLTSAGFFTIINSNEVKLLDGSESLKMEPRIYDKEIIFNTIKGESKYLIVVPDGDLQGTVVILKDDFLYGKLSHYLEAISYGIVNVLDNKVISSQFLNDKRLVSSFIENGIMWV